MLRLRVAVVGLSWIMSLVAAGQQLEPRLVAPNTVSASAGGSERLVSGQEFGFQLRFDPPPRGYGGGEINYRFENVHPAPKQNPNALFVSDGWGAESGRAELHDGQAIYNLSLPISDMMSPGTWKLVGVTLGKAVQRPVPISGDATFEIRPVPPVVIHIQAPGSVRAGQRFTFKITLDEYPRGIAPGCELWLSGKLRASQLTPDVPVSAVELKPDQHLYEMSGSFDPDVPLGTWQGEVNISACHWPPRFPAPNSAPGNLPAPGCPSPNTPPPTIQDFCRSPQLRGDLQLRLNVEPAVGLVTPTSVAVLVNPSQADLLRDEAKRLKAKAQHIRQQLSSESVAANQVLLRNSVQEAMSELGKTEDAYKGMGGEPSYAKAINAFFDDIRVNYGEAIKNLPNDSATARRTGPRLERVSAALGDPSIHLNPASEAVLGSILHNVKAYNVVASAGKLTFDLEVYSVPEGATISYRLLGDAYETAPRVTDSKIENLPIAVWYIRLQKTGYRDWEGRYDATTETERSIKGTLRRRGGAR